jgi:hypothetical protein
MSTGCHTAFHCIRGSHINDGVEKIGFTMLAAEVLVKGRMVSVGKTEEVETTLRVRSSLG